MDVRVDCEESWVLNNWCFWTVVLEKTLESPLDCKEIQPVHSEGDQSWVFIGRTDAEAETPILWPPHVKSWLIGKSPTQWTWIWVNSGSWWRTGTPGVLQFTGSQRGGHDWTYWLNWLTHRYARYTQRQRKPLVTQEIFTNHFLCSENCDNYSRYR